MKSLTTFKEQLETDPMGSTKETDLMRSMKARHKSHSINEKKTVIQDRIGSIKAILKSHAINERHS